MSVADRIVGSLIERGDLAHLALFAWGAAASLLAVAAVRALGEANQRFDAFVRELQHFNRRHSGDDR